MKKVSSKAQAVFLLMLEAVTEASIVTCSGTLAEQKTETKEENGVSSITVTFSDRSTITCIYEQKETGDKYSVEYT